MFSHLIGHDSIKEYLRLLVERHSTPHALLFSGPEGVGKGLFARALAAALLAPISSQQHARVLKGQHPDLHEYAPEGKSGQHSVETLRAMNEEVYLAPYESGRKVFILYAAERMLPYSSNALLKTFEEPAPDTVIILVSNAPALLLPTVLSRCCVVRFGILHPDEMIPWLQHRFDASPADASLWAAASRGSLARACLLAAKGEQQQIAHLLNVLAHGRFSCYADLTAMARSLAEEIEAAAHNTAEESQGRITTQELTALQRQRIAKDAAGTAALQEASHSYAVLEAIAAWYRDMHLLHYRGPDAALWHAPYKEALLQAVQRGHLLDLDTIIAAIDEASLALQRSNPLAHVLESLFLRLGLL